MSGNKINNSKEEAFTSPGIKPSTGKELAAAIHKNGLVGMWKNRKDISDNREFALKLRKQASERKHK